MRIATITNWAYGVTVALSLVSGATMLLASRAEESERGAVEQRDRFDHLSSLVEEDVFRLTEQSRLYAISGDLVHLVVYKREAAELKSTEAWLRRLRDAGAVETELNALRQGLQDAELLVDEQHAGISAVRAGDSDAARRILFGAEYERDLERIHSSVQRFQYMIDQRSDRAVVEATGLSRLLRNASEALLSITALLFLFVLYFVIKQRILRPVVRMSDVVTRLADQDYAVEPPSFDHVDEIGDMAQAIRVFRDNGLERQRLEKEREADRELRDLLSRMTQRLQGCGSFEEVGDVANLFATRIAPAFSGCLYIQDAATNRMAMLASWQEPHSAPASLHASHCWGLRRGQLHRRGGDRLDIVCEHIDGTPALDTICIPLTAQGETIGLIYFEEREPVAEAAAVPEVYLELLAENIGMAIANLRLREELRQMALVDPLTGLSNRRQLDSVLHMQLAQAQRGKETLGCLMVDVDHFKQFNDRFGHDAGDAVLRAVGAILGNSIRDDGMAFRFGGEEFLLLMPGFEPERAVERAERIRQEIKQLSISHDGVLLDPVTASMGLAIFPDHGSGEALVKAADAALYRAKDAGRDRIVIAEVRRQDVAA